MADRDRLDAEVGDPGVVAEQALRPERGDKGERRRVEHERESEAPHRRAQREPLDDQCPREEDERQKHVLDPRERRQPGKQGETELVAAIRAGERADAEVDRAEDERVGNRVGEHERGEEEVGRGDGQRRGAEGRPGAAAEPADEQVGRHRRERHEERVLRLRQPVGDGGVVRQPEGRRHQRLEHCREVGRVPADQRPATLGQRARDPRVDVLVREVERGGVHDGGREADGEADGDDPGENQAGRDRRRACECFGPRKRDVDRHEIRIGTGRASLERGILPW